MIYQKRYGKFPFFHIANLAVYIMIVCPAYYLIETLFESDFKKDIILRLLFLFSLGCCCFIGGYHPYTEKFFVEDNVIHHKKGKYSEEIKIPADAVFVVSHMVEKYYFTKRYLINIVADDIDEVLEKLHENDSYNQEQTFYHTFKYHAPACYNNYILKGRFRNRWYYCFLFEKKYAEQFFAEQQKPIIIPRSIADKIDLDTEKFNVIIDEKG